MKKLILLFAVSVLSMQFFSCSTDYSGPDPENQTPTINILETSEDNLTDITSSKRTRVQWYGNDPDGAKTVYYYMVTTDTSLTAHNVLANYAAGGVNEEGKKYWLSTDKNYAFLSMPYGPFPNENTPVFIQEELYEAIDSTYVEATDEWVTVDYNIPFKAVWSKFFVYGVDENDAVTEIQSKLFRRTNRIPKHPMVFSSKLGLNGFDRYWMTVGPDSAQMVLPAQTPFWNPFDFKWMGEDPDGPDVDLEFKWELWERTASGLLLVTESNWSVNNLSKNLSKELFDHNKQGKYRFIVRVRDDAFEESEHPSTINFEVFAPEFDKGILVIDDNDPWLTTQSTTLYMGNPDAEEAQEFYRSVLEYSGFQPMESATDPMKGYTIAKFEKSEEITGWEYIWGDHDDDPSTPDVITDSLALKRYFYFPDVRMLTAYNLVIIVSDDRSNSNGIDFSGGLGFTGYNTYLSNYLDVGGSLFFAGPSVVMGKSYLSPNQLPINKYESPYRYIFDGYSQAGQALSTSTENFMNKYFGIYSMTFPEQKTYYTIPGTNTNQYNADHHLADNYDFVGATIYEHIGSHPADNMLTGLKVDSLRANRAFYDVAGAGGRIRAHSLKDNGTVFTGVPTFEAYKGELVYKYRSIYDLPRTNYDPNLAYQLGEAQGDTLFHSLLWENKITGETGPVLKRSGAVATRFIAEGSIFKTAFFGFPPFFMDNSENQINDMFKSMIEWFDINNNGGSK